MSSVKMVSHVRSVFLNWRRARWTACFIVITVIVHPAQSQQTKPAEQSLASTLKHGALTSISDKTASNAVAMVRTTRPVFESVIVGQRTLADATQHRGITTSVFGSGTSDIEPIGPAEIARVGLALRA